MAEEHADRVHPETVVLDIGRHVGALMIYAESALRGREIEVSPCGNPARVHVEVLERRIDNQPVFAAVFPALQAGAYDIWDSPDISSNTVTIRGGEVTTVDWRHATSLAPHCEP